MFKLVIVVCILLVIWDTEGASVSKVSKRLDSLVESQDKRAKKSLAELIQNKEKISNTQKSYEEEINRIKEEAIADWDAFREENTAQYGSENSCVSSSIKVSELVELAASAEIENIENSTAELQSNYDIISSALENFSSKLNDMTLEAENCKSDSVTAEECIEWIYASINRDARDELEKLLNESEELVKKLKKERKNMNPRRATSVFSNLLEKTKHARTGIKECLIANSISES